MFCTNCGSNIPDGANSCPNCGAAVNNGNNAFEQAKNAANNMFNSAEQQMGSAIHDAANAFNGNYNPNGGQPLKSDRGLAVYILLSIITCGIYSYFFIWQMAHDVNIACDGDGDSTPGLVAFIVLSIVTCGFYSLYWYYKLGNRLANNAPRYGMNFQENGTTILLWYLVGAFVCGLGPWIAMYILIKNSNSICAAYNRAHGYN